MTFEGHRDREHPPGDIHAHGVRDWPPPLNQQSLSGMCFVHDPVIGLFVSRYEFG